MFQRDLMIAGLQKQQQLLSKLIEDIEASPKRNAEDWKFFDENSKRVANNLRKLRKIKSNYFAFAGDLICCS